MYCIAETVGSCEARFRIIGDYSGHRVNVNGSMLGPSAIDNCHSRRIDHAVQINIIGQNVNINRLACFCSGCIV